MFYCSAASAKPIIKKKAFSRLSPNFQKPFKYIHPVAYNDRFYFLNEEGIFSINLHRKKVKQYKMKIPAENQFGGGLFVNSNYLVWTSFCGEVYLMDLNLEKVKVYKHSRKILSPPVIEGNSLYFIDIGSGIVEINLKLNTIRNSLPKNTSQEIYTDLAPPVITDKYIIYGSTLGEIYFVDKKTFNWKKLSIQYKSVSHIFRRPVMKDQYIFFSSDSHTICIDTETVKKVWEVQIGSNCDLILFQEQLVLVKDSFLLLMDLNGITRNTFQFPRCLVNPFIADSRLCLLDVMGNLHILVDNQFHSNFLGELRCPSFSCFQNEKLLSFLDKNGDIYIFSLQI